MDQLFPQIGTILAALFGAVAGSYMGQQVELRRERRTRTAELYAQWVHAVALIAVHGRSADGLATLIEVKARLAALAPADLVREFAEVEREGANTASPEVQAHVVRAAQLLRRHAGLDEVSDIHLSTLLFGTPEEQSRRSRG